VQVIFNWMKYENVSWKDIESGYCLLKLVLYFVCAEQLMKSITNEIIHYSGCKIICFQNSSIECYQYTSKAAVIKLSFWVHWHVMLLMCCRLQELEVSSCYKMTDGGLLDGTGSMHVLTSLRLTGGSKLTAQALSMFLHWPSMTFVVLLDLTACFSLDDEGLKGIAKRCNKLIYWPV
jgi:hypothetical protein